MTRKRAIRTATFAAAATVLLAGSGLGQNRVASSSWAAFPPAVDGLAREWAGDYLYYEGSVDADYAFRNDAGNLYILAVFRNAKILEPMERTGFTIYVSAPDSEKRAHGVRFLRKSLKAEAFIQMLENRGRPLTEAEKAELRAESRHPVFVAAVVDDRGKTLDPPEPGSGTLPPAFSETRAQGAATFEFRLPLGPDGGLFPGGLDSGRTLRVEFEWGGSGEGVLTAKSTWQSPATRMSGGVITGSGETRAQEFLSAFDNMSRPRIDEKKYSFSVDVRTAGPGGR